MITTHIDYFKRLRIVFDNEHTTAPGRYMIFFEGLDRVVVGQAFEAPAAIWQRVLEEIADMRAVIRRRAWRGREHYFAAVYAGIQPTELQKKEHLKDWVSFCLFQLADPAHNKDVDSQLEALIFLSELHGLNQPETFIVPTLEQLNEEIASHQVQK